MSEPFLGQVEVFSFNFAPKGWTMCQGQLLSIQQNTALFALLGTTYGGNGTTNFGLPDLRSRVPVGWGQGPGLSNYDLGQKGGEEAHTLIVNEMASHNHSFMADTSAPATNNTEKASPSVVLGNTTGKQSGVANPFALTLYTSGAPGGTLDPNSIGFTGGNQGHPNIMPYLALNFCISLIGIFPTRN
ncbi:MAG: phage tail protein [Hyphomicrobiales bacterium]|nr:phage tail protein [Hyphomicrobiales bacterium]MBV9430087.1 phage tail protein [Bradyrhizobiaceae bacterium]